MRCPSWFKGGLLFLALAGSLSGCGVFGQSNKKVEAACPQGIIPADSAHITRFRDGPGRDLTDVLTEGQIYDILIQCKYDKQSVTVDLQIGFIGLRGPADRSRNADFEYWVAIVDPSDKIVERTTSRAVFRFNDNESRLTQVKDDLEPYIPLSDLKAAPNYQIIVGFQLTAAELAWNREQRAKQK
jgi:hypothetical protein